MAESVSDIMSTPVLTLREEDNLLDIRRAMEAKGVRHVPVADGDKLVGLVTHRDILRLTGAEVDPSTATPDRLARAEEQTFVRDVMVTDVVSISADTTIPAAAQLLVDHHFGCLPVVDATGKLLGLVTDQDLLKYLARG